MHLIEIYSTHSPMVGIDRHLGIFRSRTRGEFLPSQFKVRNHVTLLILNVQTMRSTFNFQPPKHTHHYHYHQQQVQQQAFYHRRRQHGDLASVQGTILTL